MEETFGVNRCQAEDKVTEFTQEAQDARCGDSGAGWIKGASLYFDLTDKDEGGMVRTWLPSVVNITSLMAYPIKVWA